MGISWISMGSRGGFGGFAVDFRVFLWAFPGFGGVWWGVGEVLTSWRWRLFMGLRVLVLVFMIFRGVWRIFFMVDRFARHTDFIQLRNKIH